MINSLNLFKGAPAVIEKIIKNLGVSMSNMLNMAGSSFITLLQLGTTFNQKITLGLSRSKTALLKIKSQ